MLLLFWFFSWFWRFLSLVPLQGLTMKKTDLAVKILAFLLRSRNYITAVMLEILLRIAAKTSTGESWGILYRLVSRDCIFWVTFSDFRFGNGYLYQCCLRNVSLRYLKLLFALRMKSNQFNILQWLPVLLFLLMFPRFSEPLLCGFSIIQLFTSHYVFLEYPFVISVHLIF